MSTTSKRRPFRRTRSLRLERASRWGRLLAALLVTVATLSILATAEPAAARWSRVPVGTECTDGVLILGYSDRLDKATFDGTNVGGLSALAHDAARDRYYGLVDNEEGTQARFYSMSIAQPGGRSFAGPTLLDVTTLTDRGGTPFTDTTLDGEGMAVTEHGTLLVASEVEPSIREFSSSGRELRELPIPERFLVAPQGEGQANQSIESLTLAPDGRTLYSATESRLLVDGDGQIRVLRHDLPGIRGAQVSGEFYYQTDAGLSVGELLAYSETELLVLERTYTPDVGNTIRIYLTSTAGAQDVSNVASLDGAGIAPLPKELLVDIVTCPPGDATVKQPQPNPLLDNFEGMAFGPVVNGGYQTLYLLSDDNFNPVQVTRVIALGIDQDLLTPS